MEFPAIEITPDEEVNTAYEKAVRSFEASGFKVDRVPNLNQHELPTDASRFTRIFIVSKDTQAHLFFVCPYSWTKQMASMVVDSGARISTGMAQDGDRAVFHFLSAY